MICRQFLHEFRDGCFFSKSVCNLIFLNINKKKKILTSGFFQRKLSFSKVPGGSNCLFPIETHITCDFPGGGGGGGGGPYPVPPLDPPMRISLTKA